MLVNTPSEIEESGHTIQEDQELSFEQLLDSYNFDMPYRGQILEAIVLKDYGDEILLDVGLKRDAIVPRKDLSLLDPSVRKSITVGAEILAYVLQPRDEDGELIVSINKALELEDWEKVNKLMEEESIVEAEVVDSNKGGLLVRYGRLAGFVPQSHIISLPRFASQDELYEAKKRMIGRKLPLKFIEVDRRRNRLIMSERLAQAQTQQTRLSELQVGQVVKGRVVSIVDFGAFVDLGGVDGLIHISKLAHNHVNHPGEVVSVGDEEEVVIDGIDEAKQRISLDRAALLPDPWDTVNTDLTVGDLVQGKVTNVVDFGAFVQLPNGLQGLVHISEMTIFGTTNPRDMLRESDPVLVRVTNIEASQRRIALSIDKVTVEEQEDWMHSRRETTGDIPAAVPVTEEIIADELDDTDIPAATIAETE